MPTLKYQNISSFSWKLRKSGKTEPTFPANDKQNNNWSFHTGTGSQRIHTTPTCPASPNSNCSAPAPQPLPVILRMGITTHLPLGKASLRDTATQLSLSFKKNCFLPPYKEVAEIFFFFLCLFRFYLLIKFFKIPGMREDILFFMPAVTRTWT